MPSEKKAITWNHTDMNLDCNLGDPFNLTFSNDFATFLFKVMRIDVCYVFIRMSSSPRTRPIKTAQLKFSHSISEWADTQKMFKWQARRFGGSSNST